MSNPTSRNTLWGLATIAILLVLGGATWQMQHRSVHVNAMLVIGIGLGLAALLLTGRPAEAEPESDVWPYDR
jgi:hypothetical protein